MQPLPFVSDARPAIIVPILARTGDAAVRQAIAASSRDEIDAFEWRIDPLFAVEEQPENEGGRAGLEYEELELSYGAFARSGVPTLVTVRSEAEGGYCPVEAYAEAVTDAIALSPAAVDVEVGREESADLLVAARSERVATVASAHWWAETPPEDELDAMFARMAASGADAAKIAVMPESVGDVLTLLGATWRASQTHGVPVIGIAMGELGRVTRLCGGEFGSAATFATVGTGSAPGQMTAEQVDIVRSILLRG